MTPKSKIVRITLCSPSDVSKERDIVLKEIEQWNLHHWDKMNCGIKLRHWQTDAVPDMSDRPQGVINRQLVDDADAVVALFWSRFGTPTGVAQSGTEEEVRRAMASKTRVMLYFSDLEPLPPNVDETQLSRLQAFRAEMCPKGLAWKFRNRAEFRGLFRGHLNHFMDDIVLKEAKKMGASRKPRSGVTQIGNGNTNVEGDGNVTTIYHKAPTIRQVVPPPPGSIDSSQQHQITQWIEKLAELTSNKTKSEAFAMWWSRLKKAFKVSKYEHIPAASFLEVHEWYSKNAAIGKQARKSRAPQLWRTDRIQAIKTAMRSVNRTNEEYYPELSRRLRMKVFSSLTELTKTDLERVYRMVMGDARK